MRFNPPPQWPQPPAGWTPPPGWQPDPSWPPAPPGWQLWVEDALPPPSYPPAGYGAPVGLPQYAQAPYAQPQYAQPQYAQPPYFGAPQQRSHRTFWIVFGIVNALLLVLVIGIAAISPSDASCVNQNLSVTDCTNQQHAWIGGIFIWVLVDLVLLGVWAFRRRGGR